jgi:hypothetical protein
VGAYPEGLPDEVVVVSLGCVVVEVADTDVVVAVVGGGAVAVPVDCVPEDCVAGASVVVVVVVVVGAAPVSGEVQPDGGALGPCWPGMSTVPAQPKFDRVTSRTTVPPSEKRATDLTSRMKPELSMDTSSVVPE